MGPQPAPPFGKDELGIQWSRQPASGTSGKPACSHSGKKPLRPVASKPTTRKRQKGSPGTFWRAFGIRTRSGTEKARTPPFWQETKASRAKLLPFHDRSESERDEAERWASRLIPSPCRPTTPSAEALPFKASSLASVANGPAQDSPGEVSLELVAVAAKQPLSEYVPVGCGSVWRGSTTTRSVNWLV